MSAPSRTATTCCPLKCASRSACWAWLLLNVTLQKGLDARLRALDAAAAKAAPTVQADIKFPAEYIRKINTGVIGAGTFDLAGDLAAAEATAAAAVKAKKDPFVGRTGDFERHYVLDGANEIMPYRVFVPKAYTGTKAFPLIIALHGLGGTEDGMLDRYGKRIPTLAEDRGYIVASPLGYRVDGFYGSAIAATSDARERRQRELSEQDVMQVLKRMRADYKIDESRIYLMGHSMGAIGAWALAAKYPDIWAAVAPFAGVAIPASVARFRHIPQFVVHGDADPTVNVIGLAEHGCRDEEAGRRRHLHRGARRGSLECGRPEHTRHVRFFRRASESNTHCALGAEGAKGAAGVLRVPRKPATSD